MLYAAAKAEFVGSINGIFGFPALMTALTVLDGNPCSQFLQSNQSVLANPVHMPAVPVETVTVADPVRSIDCEIHLASLNDVIV